MVGRAGWLWLNRPPGWEVELAAEITESDNATRARSGATEERRAARRVVAAETARDRAAGERDQARAELERVRVALAVERRARQVAEEESVRLERRQVAVEGERDAARRRAESATEQAEERDRAVADLELEVIRVRDELARARTRAGPPQQSDANREGSSTGLPGPSDLRREETVPSPPGPGLLGQAVAEPSGPSASAVTQPPGVEPEVLASAFARAAQAAETLGASLAETSVLLGSSTAAQRTGDDATSPTAPVTPARPVADPRPTPAPSRRPAPLPPAVFEDSREAAEHLVRLPGATLVVDGYNASIKTWPDLPIADQRRRLVYALEELTSRTHVAVEVVFDGAEVVDDGGPDPARSFGGGSRRVKVAFTAADIEADDVVVDRAARLATPVIVASDDHRVRDGARGVGANVVTVGQLLGVLRRAG